LDVFGLSTNTFYLGVPLRSLSSTSGRSIRSSLFIRPYTIVSVSLPAVTPATPTHARCC